MRNLINAIIIVLAGSLVYAQNDPDSNYAFYEGQTYSFLMEAPEEWKLNLEDAQFDGLSAFFCPEEMDYFDAKYGISIWIFKLDSLTFREFITADSSAYAGSDSLEFDKIDSLDLADDKKAIALRVKDPGGVSSTAIIAYIDGGKDIIIYELNIRNRRFYTIAYLGFEEALKKFSFVR